jgi:hypothetical protein
MYLKAWVSFQIFRPCELHGCVCKTSISSEVNHQMESPLSSLTVQSVYIEYNIAVQHSTGMAAQYGKMAMRDVIPPWAETMVRYAGCHPAGGSKRLRKWDFGFMWKCVARAFHQYIRYYNTIFFDKRYGHLNVHNRDNRNFTKSRKFAS